MSERIAIHALRPPGPVDLHSFANPLTEAVAAARYCEWCEHAFYYGYQAALRLSFPRLPSGPLAMCHSERGGNTPKQLQCRAMPTNGGWQLRGHKIFLTSPELCTQALVSAVCAEDSQGQRDIGVFLVQLDELLLSVQAYPEARIMPRLGQGELTLEGVYATSDNRISGGYDSLIRPFGVCETLCCAAGLAAMGAGRAQRWGDEQLKTQAESFLEQVLSVLQGDCAAPQTVLACESLAASMETLKVDLLRSVQRHQSEALEDWTRDIRVFGFSGPLWDRRYARARQDPDS